MAQRLQDAARTEFDELGVLPRAMQPHRPTVWSRLRAAPGTLGHDYLALARRTRLLGSAKLARDAAFAGLAAAPLSLDLWREWVPAQANPRRWLRWLRGNRIPRH